ncbi:hypothetical protein H6P81_008370 [Aristolochia fimbriata]|uniref:Uncharacterized protein n=1 Tax=Aristolochia fimbriata TaxID=158543 RepID=A0AAV7F433_ARIFI|nr:hypothetical protein H6P81_008370 [Aristolochia fimbriata]
MATLYPFLPSPNPAASKLRTPVVVSAGGKSSQAAFAFGDDIVNGAFVSDETKRPWWAPLFRGDGARKVEDPSPEKPKPAGNRSALTAEKARLLRKELRAMETWHDPMYHSAIAARLASPDQTW